MLAGEEKSLDSRKVWDLPVAWRLRIAAYLGAATPLPPEASAYTAYTTNNFVHPSHPPLLEFYGLFS